MGRDDIDAEGIDLLPLRVLARRAVTPAVVKSGVRRRCREEEGYMEE